MGLFKSKSATSSESVNEHESLDIQKIPDLFYGGNNPVIYDTLAPSKDFVVKSAGTPTPPRATQFSEPSKQVPISKLIVLVVSVGILVVGGASAYFVIQYLSAKNTVSVVPISTSSTALSSTTVPSGVVLPSSTSNSIDLVTTSTMIDTVSTTISLTSNFLEFPPVNLGTTADVDLDQVTDIEEVLYSTDSGGWDTDEDGYYDGLEIVNLYNPRGFAPVRIVDSGLVREYTNSFAGYRIYYPIQWREGVVDSEARHVLFSTLTGEYVEVRVFSKNQTVSFAEWFQVNASTEQFSSLSSFTNRFGIQGFRRSDNLVAYFSTDAYVFVLLYQQPDSRAPIPFRTTFEMMYQSFRPSGTSAQLPEQSVIESVGETVVDTMVSSSMVTTSP